MSTPTKPVLIVGAGLSGLLLAQGLKRARIPFRIFERDKSLQNRSQGYQVRITRDGALAIERTVCPELYKLFEDSCAMAEPTATKVNALTGVTEAIGLKPPSVATVAAAPGESVICDSPRAHDIYNADRSVLRAVLGRGLEDVIEFDKAFDRYHESAEGIVVHFTDDSSAQGSLLVGADGARSLIRRQYLPDHKPLDSQCRAILGKTPVTDELMARLHKDTAKIAIVRDQRPIVLFMEPVRFRKDKEAAMQAEGITRPADYIYWDIGGWKEFFPLSDEELIALSPEETAKLSLELTKDWHPRIRAVFELQIPQHALALRIATCDAAWKEWTPSAHITLIGDAVHVMSPASGNGTTTALNDAAYGR